MAAIADFLSDIIDGIGWVAFSLALGGLVWSFVILRVQRADSPFRGAPVARAIALIRLGAFVLGVALIVELAADAYILAATMNRSPFPALYHAAFFQAAALRALFCFAMALAAGWLGRAPYAWGRWRAVILLGACVVVAGAWHSHGASRVEDRAVLMTLTTVHSLAGALWVGGVLNLLALRLLAWRDDALRPLWPLAVSRFTPLGIAVVGLAVVTATPLALYYVRSFANLIGTGYGSMVIVKAILLLCALAFAGLNYRAGREWTRGGSASDATLRRRTPYLVEAETFILISLLMAAAALAHQPPGLDLGRQTATYAEVAHVFMPKVPRVTSPVHADMPIDTYNPIGLSARGEQLEIQWSEYNHNVSGLVLMTMAVLALLSRFKGFHWARHWPLGFVPFAVFLLIRSDPETWPLGHVPFWVSMRNGEVFQHRIAILLAAVLGLIEWRARATGRKDAWYAYVFPFLAAFGGLLLLTHSHSAFELKPQYLIQVTHTAMGLFAMALAIGRWLELRLEPPASNWAGSTALASLFVIGLLLTFYQEAAGTPASALKMSHSPQIALLVDPLALDGIGMTREVVTK